MMWHGGKRPRLKAEGDVYGAEEEDTSKGEDSEGDSNNASSQEVVYMYTRSSLYSSLKHFPPYCFLQKNIPSDQRKYCALLLK